VSSEFEGEDEVGRESRKKAKWCRDVKIFLLHGRKVAQWTGAARGAKLEYSKW
jgi:hypothetical protein